MRKNISTLKLHHNKHTAGCQSVKIAPPEEVLLHLTTHRGTPAEPVVAVGDYVRIGQLVAAAGSGTSSPVHASVSGTVAAIETLVQADGKSVPIMRIKSDGKMEKDPNLAPPTITDLDSFLSAMKDSGVVSLGGSGFPLWSKFDSLRRYKIETLLLNGAECEPYICSDHRIMLEDSHMLKAGVELLLKYSGIERVVICIEDNKQDAIDNLTKIFEDDSRVEIRSLPSIYPQGAKQVLLYNVTGKVVKGGQRMSSLGVLITNVSSVTKMAEYMTTGMPLVERIVTVDGTAVKEPKNLRVPIGTPVSHIIEQAGGLKCEAFKVLIGGPMLGKPLVSLDQPTLKTANSVLFLSKKEAAQLEPSACIRCGRCMANCPVSLNPEGIAAAMELEDEDKRYARLKNMSIGQCIECACCSYVCPAHKPVMHINKDARKFMDKYQAAHAEEGRK